MRIVIYGTGGVGGYFGGLLARADEDVTFIARGEHLRAIRAHGLRVESVHGDFTIAPASATDNPAEIGPVDLIIAATKTYHIDEVARGMTPLLGPRTAILPLQNGVDASERIAAIVGPAPVLGGVCYVGSHIAAPGLIRQGSQFRRVVVGELAGQVTPRVTAVVDALARSGAVAEASAEINQVRWTKFTFIAPFSGVGAVTRVPAGEIMACPETRQMMADAMQEVEAVARARGIRLAADIVPQTMAFCDKLAPGQMASMQRDLLDGRPSELESMIGVIVRHGAELGVPTPVFQFVYAALAPQEHRARAA